jgi:hypothetical protein
MNKKRKLKICSRGHRFYKSSDCPTCPICWKRKKPNKEFPKISAPALRALLNAGIITLKDLSKWSEGQIRELHGIGPSTIPKLRIALKKNALSFSK